MRIGEPFNPWRVFQGAFAPFWLLEHPHLGAGAKLCYVRLLGFAGRDGHCYPALETLGASLGVSERQARGYVRELERAGLIAVEQRGLRRTNVYLFLWTADLDGIAAVAPEPTDPEDTPAGGGDDPTGHNGSALDRKNSSGQNRKSKGQRTGKFDGSHAPSRNIVSTQVPPDRNTISALDRNDFSGLDRKSSSGPIGIISAGISSQESSSSGLQNRLMQREEEEDVRVPQAAETRLSATAALILRWVQTEGIQRRRADGSIGGPDEPLIRDWAGILDRFCPADGDRELWIGAAMENARDGADRSGDWRNWSFLTLQVQLAAERTMVVPHNPPLEAYSERPVPPEDPDSPWARAKAMILAEIGEIPFSNWFAASRQTGVNGASITIEFPTPQTKEFVEMDYSDVIARAALLQGFSGVVIVAPQLQGNRSSESEA